LEESISTSVPQKPHRPPFEFIPLKNLIMKRRPNQLRDVFVLYITLPTLTSPNATSYTWTSGRGTWTNASLWSPNGIPGINDDDVISGGTHSLDAGVP
jgi:hypothetical protein